MKIPQNIENWAHLILSLGEDEEPTPRERDLQKLISLAHDMEIHENNLFSYIQDYPPHDKFNLLLKLLNIILSHQNLKIYKDTLPNGKGIYYSIGTIQYI